MLLLLTTFCLINISIFFLYFLINLVSTFRLIRGYIAIFNTLQIIFISTKEHPTITKLPVSAKMYTIFKKKKNLCRWVDLDRFSFKWLNLTSKKRERRSQSSDSILLSFYADMDKFSFYVLNFCVYWNKQNHSSDSSDLVKVERRIISPIDWRWASLTLIIPKGPKFGRQSLLWFYWVISLIIDSIGS